MSIIEKLRQFLSPNDKPPVTSNAPSPDIVPTVSSQPTPVDLIAIDEQRIREDFWEAMRAIVRAHGKALQIKRAQLVLTDAYGNSIEDKFAIERDYFIKSVMYRDVPAHLLEFLMAPSSLELGRTLFAQGMERYEMLTGHTVPSVKVGPDLSGVEYEQYCLQELRAAGWAATSTKASGDQGIDLIATTESITVVGQCKFYSNPVGNSAVQEAIAGREFQRADYAFVVTNSTFTPSARSLAAASDVLLLHHSELCDLAKKLDILVRKPAHLPERELLSLPNTSRPLPDILREAEELMAKLKARELGHDAGEDDPLYNQAVQIVLENKLVSISLVQRNLRIGYNRAARLIEDMEAKGLVSPMASNGSRKLLR